MTTEPQLRILEALLFAASEPLDEATIATHFAQGPLGEGADVPALLATLKEEYATRGVNLFETGGRWSLRTAADMAVYLKLEVTKPVKISRVAAETLAVIAYHQPVTRAEIEAIRGVATSKDVLEKLMETSWVRMGPRRETPGQPVTWLTTPSFLDHFGLSSTKDLPGMAELKSAGLLDAEAPITYGVVPSDAPPEVPRVDDVVDQDEQPEEIQAEDEEPTILIQPEAESVEETAEEIQEEVAEEMDEADHEAIAEELEDELEASSAEAEEIALSDDDADEDDDEITDSDDDDDFDDDDDDFDDDDEEAELDEEFEVAAEADESVTTAESEEAEEEAEDKPELLSA